MQFIRRIHTITRTPVECITRKDGDEFWGTDIFMQSKNMTVKLSLYFNAEEAVEQFKEATADIEVSTQSRPNDIALSMHGIVFTAVTKFEADEAHDHDSLHLDVRRHDHRSETFVIYLT